ncbi:hypothetical protein HOU03_gp009 [Caulobacter phage CcrSC]|uniref:Uncharacterized protein n=1 Tax=Caulobacter phage CcrSC TaxID=2283272 RepID=A0A385ECI1_9CAUD|nr:hypothetical protein HOU03_gp177 [Caulobacter phage CcrSC]YP_009810721.1 hypothetical protein HOU03_gp009 [Caulobacter phage CcrSC]AXQ69591.1 hypothetical protein CcrSC_gp509 [Caulobacter phage CcrSC]AXQ70091.1 hypothetical protein CcrSC_gp009 [Caulobacter phage CcrSC]
MEFFVRTTLVSIARHWEDGADVIATCYCVCVEYPDGARYVHDYQPVDRYVSADDEGEPIYPWRDGEAIKAKLDALRDEIAAHVAAGGSLDPGHWFEVDPRYGSPAYMGLDAFGFFRAREKQEAAERGD